MGERVCLFGCVSCTGVDWFQKLREAVEKE